MDIPIDSTIVCVWHKRAPCALRAAFFHRLQRDLNAMQAAMLYGARVVRKADGPAKLAQVVTVGESDLVVTQLPDTEIRVKSDNGGISVAACRIAEEFTLSLGVGWQRDIIMDTLRQFQGKYFRFDIGAKGADRRRLPMGRRLATKGRDIAPADMTRRRKR